ncbi:unnamed protein product [Echinostoma caproni]|uniref:Microtub_bind domain-containing protein n=1 Tax=Echinostoma caproni TaxID=27848 RepID=A0A183AFX8_9TREM|nr:unnamed protein product [Echinostoma caproni]
MCHKTIETFADAAVQLRTANTSAENAEEEFRANHHNHLADLSSHIDQMTSVREGLKNGLVEFIENTGQRTQQFDSHGLGADLRLRVSEWNSCDSAIVDDGAVTRLQELMKANKEGVVGLLDENTEQLLKVENFCGDTSYKFSLGFTEVHDNLAQFPEHLRDRLDQDLQSYQPTGQTPQRQNFTLPSVLARTDSHRSLLARFRASQQIRSLEEVSLTPLPDSNSSFGDSPLTKADHEISDLDVFCSDQANKENRVNTSGLVS